MDFTHLHVHTQYSLLDGSSKINEIVKRAKDLGMKALAITDHGVMYGIIDFYKAAKEQGIKPIIGCEVYVSPASRFDREVVHGEDRYYHLILLAKDNKGLENLTKIVSKGFVDGYYYRPRVDYEVLKEHSEGLIALSACLAGEVPKLIMRGEIEKAREIALKNKTIFGDGNYYLELQDHGIYEQKAVNEELIKISKDLDIPLVATNDVHYINAEDAVPHDILLCIQTGKKVSDKDRMRYEGGQFYLKSPEQMDRLFSYIPEALENTNKIAGLCNVEIEFGVTKLPEYDVPDNMSSEVYLRKLCYEGLDFRYDTIDDTLKERMEYELGIIEKMGYIDYFLIVWDYINYAKKHDIPVGPGRGSAAGSIVAYCLGITDVDPIKYNLLFERFLNPERVSMPDIDVDFCYERRQEVIDYVIRKYGKERVCQIITFGTLAARGVVRDVGRALDLPYSLCDTIAKLIPTEIGMNLEKALSVSKELKQKYDTDTEIKNLIDLSMKLEGLPRHSSIHAAGVVISKKSIDEYVPVAKNSDGSITTQYTMTTLEELGLLKMDFLGLRTLTVIKKTIDQVKKNYGKDIDILKIDYDDKAVYSSIATGKTDGVFQLESAGMASFMKDLKPECLDDIIAGISLYRPGPMDFIPKYIKGKNEKDSISYECEELKPILNSTYGCIVYQEQVMQIVRDLAGYTLGRSDLLRRAMSKKKSSVMEKERQNFIYGNTDENIKGCIANGIDEKVASKIFDEMIDFAKYAFNKSHAACYAFVSYQTAYLKYYYPLEFMAALMTSVMDNVNKVSEYILTCKQMGIDILPPDVNEGESEFSVSGNGIRFGLSAIKSIGKLAAEEIIRNRNSSGKFRDLEDFISRLGNKEVNKRSLESFVKAGALDCFEGNRKQKLLIIPELIDRKTKDSKAVSGQMSLFDFGNEEQKESFKLRLPEMEEFAKEDLLNFEKEMVGVYISGHPLDAYIERLKTKTTANTLDFIINEESMEAHLKENEKVIIGGLINNVSIKLTRNNDTMAFILLEDIFSNVEVIVFPKVYEKYKKLLENDAKILISGRASFNADENGKLVAENIFDLDEDSYELWIQYANREAYDEDVANLLLDFGSFQGETPVYIYLKEEKMKKYMGDNWKVDLNDKLLSILKNRFGEGNVKTVLKK